MTEQLRGIPEDKNLPTSERLVKFEENALSLFFREKIVVSEPPTELFQIMEQLEQLGISGFEPHYLPQRSLTEDDDFPGWKVKPESWFWKQVENGKIAKDAATLREGWYLVDGRGKPAFQEGIQAYKDDYLANVMAELRAKGKVKKYRNVPNNSRFGASPLEIEQVILPELASKVIQANTVRQTREIEFNIWGNMFHPEWGETDTLECFADKFGRGGGHLVGGYWNFGGFPSSDGCLSIKSAAIINYKCI